MKFLEHENNNAGWRSKEGEAQKTHILKVARAYRKAYPAAWCVVVCETETELYCYHLRAMKSVVSTAEFGVKFWISNGREAERVI